MRQQKRSITQEKFVGGDACDIKNEENDKETWCREEEEWESGTQTDSQIFCIVVLLQLDIQSMNFPKMIPISPMRRAATRYIMGTGVGATFPDDRMGVVESAAVTAAARRSLRISS